MPGLICDASWTEINALRDRLMARKAESVEEAAQGFAEDLARSFPTIALARLFVVLPVERLSAQDRAAAASVAAGHADLLPTTPALVLLGTAGHDGAWRDRTRSVGHRAFPLLNRQFVQHFPMIAKLLADIEVNLAALDDGTPIVTRRLLGGSNNTFFVADAQAALESSGRYVIPAREFVAARGIRTVFGMAGAYLDGTLAVTIVFTTELLERSVVDRFPSLISNFKMATVPLIRSGRLYAQAPVTAAD